MTYPSKKTHSIPYSIWALGGASLLLNMSSVIVFSLSPLFITQVLGTSTAVLGLLEGIIESISLFTRIFSGILSDFLKKRKVIILFGYGLAFISRPLLAVATTITSVLVARTFDRIGNGLIATPRDALIGDLSPPDIKGACYGLRESLSRTGSFLGSLLAIYLLWITANNYSFVFWIAAIPTAIGLILLMIFVNDKSKKTNISVSTKEEKTLKAKKMIKEMWHLPKCFWLVILLSGVFMLSNFSGAFLILRGKQMGLPIHLIPLVMVVQNAATAFIAYPVGYLSDRIGRRSILAIGILLVILSNLLLSLDGSITLFFFGILLWGAEMGITQSILAVLLADACPSHLRGTGFGLFHFINGICLLLTNIIAGWAWGELGSASLFYGSATMAGLAGLLLPFIRMVKPSNRQSL